MRVKIIETDDSSKYLEKLINEFLSSDNYVKIIDIKYMPQVNAFYDDNACLPTYYYSYQALIMYEELPE